ncbi:MAG: hypothetical protein JXK93_14410 [Sphaerochaetaceae bacterium]|nr:hypothetical protein [Sphaerochaetaceae bacterium]
MGENLIGIIAIVTPFLFAGWVISLRRHRSDKMSEQSEELERGMKDLAKRIENLEIILRGNHSDKR